MNGTLKQNNLDIREGIKELLQAKKGVSLTKYLETYKGNTTASRRRLNQEIIDKKWVLDLVHSIDPNVTIKQNIDKAIFETKG